MKNYLIFSTLLIFYSCKIYPGDDQIYIDPEGAKFDLNIKPQVGAAYAYQVSTTTETLLEVEDRKVENSNKATIEMSYAIDMDSAGDYLFGVSYDKIRMNTKNGDVESSADADNASFSLNPVDQMLGALKDAKLVATISPAGEVKNINGYNELSAQLMSNLSPTDPNARGIAQKHIDRLIGEGMIENNLTQLFKMFPDSAVRVGERWKILSKQKGEFTMNATTTYQLKRIDGGTVHIISKSEMSADESPQTVMGTSVQSNLKGTGEGAYQLEAATGMLMKAITTSEISGTIQLMGKEIPIEVKMKTTIEGRRKK